MSERRDRDITGEFIDNPGGLYAEPDQLDARERERLFELEEMMAACLTAGRENRLRAEANSLEDEGKSAYYADHPEQALTHPKFKALLPDMLEVMAARRIMDNPGLPAVALPRVLRDVVSRGFEEGDDAPVPSVILGLAAQGIEVIKSTMRGIALQPQAFTYTRSAPTPGVLEKQSRIELHQVFEDAPDIQLEYQIMRESASELMLGIRFKGMRRGTYSVSLLRDKRVIASHNLSDSHNIVSFGRLAAGSYMIEIKGAFQYKFGVLIDDSEL